MKVEDLLEALQTDGARLEATRQGARLAIVVYLPAREDAYSTGSTLAEAHVDLLDAVHVAQTLAAK